MPDDNDRVEADHAGLDTIGSLVKIVLRGDGDIYGTQGDRTGDVGNQDVSGTDRSGGATYRNNVNYKGGPRESGTAVVRRFLTEVGLKPDEVGDSWVEILCYVCALFCSNRAVWCWSVQRTSCISELFLFTIMVHVVSPSLLAWSLQSGVSILIDSYLTFKFCFAFVPFKTILSVFFLRCSLVLPTSLAWLSVCERWLSIVLSISGGEGHFFVWSMTRLCFSLGDG